MVAISRSGMRAAPKTCQSPVIPDVSESRTPVPALDALILVEHRRASTSRGIPRVRPRFGASHGYV
jgi:hypothetical protein